MNSVIRSVADLGSLLRERRKALGYTQVRVADLCGRGTRFISDLENGKESIEFGKALTVLAVLGIDLRAEIRGGRL
jgi:HTH-type transcriptional regulator/antitoxin HipB